MAIVRRSKAQKAEQEAKEFHLAEAAHLTEIAQRLSRAKGVVEELVWAEAYRQDVGYLLKLLQRKQAGAGGRT